MLYDVTLRIDYTYSHPRDQTRNLLRLLPIHGSLLLFCRFLQLLPPSYLNVPDQMVLRNRTCSGMSLIGGT